MDDAVLVYDDDCGFCTWWATAVADESNPRIVGFSELDPDGPLVGRLPDDWEDCSHLVTDDAVYSCGASVEEVLLRTGVGSHARPVAESLRESPAYRRFREWAYRTGADNRSLLGRVVSKRPPARDGGSEGDTGESTTDRGA